jgi:hypothetical protein
MHFWKTKMINFDEFKESLGETGKKMNDSQIKNLMILFDYLTDNWLKEREIRLFGKPIDILVENYL